MKNLNELFTPCLILDENKFSKNIERLKSIVDQKNINFRPHLKTAKCIEITKSKGWCDDVNFPKKYNKLITISNRVKHEKLLRKDHKYDLFIPIKYNFAKPKIGLGSCIFIHLTDNYKPTEGCVALKKKDFLIMVKLINKNTKIKIV